jgi:FAD-dependent oxidoreductase domain-containing protein 1
VSEDSDYDVILIGGGLYGTSTAYHLLMREPNLRVCIVEPDSGYEHAASARSNGGVRILFSQAESIQMSQYGHAFYAGFPDAMATPQAPAPLDLFRHGYLLMATQEQQVEDLLANLELQRSLGCNVEVHDAASLSALRPGLNIEDVRAAVYSPDDMWIDPYSAVTGFMRKARSLGAQVVNGRVAALESSGKKMTGVVLAGGKKISGDWIVNTTGAWAPEVCRLAGIEIPVQSLPLMIYYFETREDVGQFGVTVDMDTVSFRPEGAGFISLNRRHDALGSFLWDADETYFNEGNWPALAHRVPAFESLKVISTYCCHYALNTFDGNLLLGAWPGMPQNFLIATGASGHGLQHAPAAGRGLSELILDGRYSTIDLTRFGCQRVVDNRPDPERGFVA